MATGRVVGCHNSRYVDICADDSTDMSDLERIAQRACDRITSTSSKGNYGIMHLYCLLNKTHKNDNYMM